MRVINRIPVRVYRNGFQSAYKRGSKTRGKPHLSAVAKYFVSKLVDGLEYSLYSRHETRHRLSHYFGRLLLQVSLFHFPFSALPPSIIILRRADCHQPSSASLRNSDIKKRTFCVPCPNRLVILRRFHAGEVAFIIAYSGASSKNWRRLPKLGAGIEKLVHLTPQKARLSPLRTRADRQPEAVGGGSPLNYLSALGDDSVDIYGSSGHTFKPSQTGESLPA